MNSKKIVPNDLVPIGKILKAHGLLGEVKAFLYNVDSDSLKPEINIWLNIKNEFIIFEIENIKDNNKNKLIKFKNINDRVDAELLNGKKIHLSRSFFPMLKEDDFYLTDIVGFNVNDSNGKNYGFVLDIIKLPTNDSILFNYNNEEIIIPIIDDFIELFDFENKILIIKNFEGFLTK